MSPTEIEDVLRSHPNKLIIDVTVAGVGGGRTSDEKVPRAWIVLSEAGKRLGEIATIAALNAWTHENLSKYKWLRGGIEVLEEVRNDILERANLTISLAPKDTHWEGFKETIARCL